MAAHRAGELKHRIEFQKRGSKTSDDYGNEVEGWVADFTIAARIIPRFGGEEIMAARLEGKNMVSVSIEMTAKTKQVTADWRFRDVRDDVLYNIRTAIPSNDGRMVEILAERGVNVE